MSLCCTATTREACKATVGGGFADCVIQGPGFLQVTSESFQKKHCGFAMCVLYKCPPWRLVAPWSSHHTADRRSRPSASPQCLYSFYRQHETPSSSSWWSIRAGPLPDGPDNYAAKIGLITSMRSRSMTYSIIPAVSESALIPVVRHRIWTGLTTSL
jgi:hypothetical protein